MAVIGMFSGLIVIWLGFIGFLSYSYLDTPIKKDNKSEQKIDITQCVLR